MSDDGGPGKPLYRFPPARRAFRTSIPQYPWDAGDLLYAEALNDAIARAGGGSGGIAGVSEIDTISPGIVGGPITSTGTLSVQWNAGTVTTVGSGLLLNSGTLTATGSGGGGIPSGPAGGDLSGTYPNPTVATVGGVAFAASATTNALNASNISSGTLAAARLPASGVTVGNYTNTSLTVDASGRITAAASGTAGGTGTVTSITATAPLTGGTITTTGSIGLANTAVTAGSYTNTNLTVDAQGRITAAANGTAGGGGPVFSDTAPVSGTNEWFDTVNLQLMLLYNDGSSTQWVVANNPSPAPISYAQLPAEVAMVPIAFPFQGKPAAASVINIPMTMALTVAASLVGTRYFAGTASAASAVFTVNKISGGSTTALGTVTATAGSQTGATLAGAGGSLAAGDVLQLAFPASQDANMADGGVTIMAQRV